MKDYDRLDEFRRAVEEQVGPVSDTLWERVCNWSPPYDDDDLEEVATKIREARADNGQSGNA